MTLYGRIYGEIYTNHTKVIFNFSIRVLVDVMKPFFEKVAFIFTNTIE